jgi:hypothetical protein
MHICDRNCEPNVMAWLLAWARAIRIHEQSGNTARYVRAMRRFDAQVKRHRAICEPGTADCAIRRAGGAYSWAGLIDA